MCAYRGGAIGNFFFVILSFILGIKKSAKPEGLTLFLSSLEAEDYPTSGGVFLD